jgi:hypothetical protein
MDVEGVGDLSDGSPLAYEPAHQVCLLGVEFSRAPEVNPPPSGRLPASAGGFPDQVVFKLGDARKHGHDQLASVTSSVGLGSDSD